jgi:hypothetical protein
VVRTANTEWQFKMEEAKPFDIIFESKNKGMAERGGFEPPIEVLAPITV